MILYRDDLVSTILIRQYLINKWFLLSQRSLIIPVADIFTYENQWCASKSPGELHQPKYDALMKVGSFNVNNTGHSNQLRRF